MADHKLVWKHCIRNGYAMAPSGDAINSVGFVRGVKDLQVWVPKHSDLKVFK